MAKLLKLQISGIRSFGPYEDQAQQLKFGTPLTLILGQNGCGKTTIIEAIKYACANELPINTDGGKGFVNDPKMSRSATTKGQIKLKIADPRGNEVTVCRVVEVTQQATSMKFASKSSTIRVVGPDGSDRQVSGRCVDVTSECCQVMNVPAPVLSNVIFCHQENSAWPLDEGKKLKEKFDDIFDAQKHNKCTEMLRALYKNKMDKIKVLTVELQYRREKKQYVDNQHRILRDKENRLEEFERIIQTKGEQLEPLEKRIDEILELEKKLGDLQSQLTAKQATKAGVVEEQNTIKRSLAFEFNGNDEELQEKIRSFEQDRAKEEDLVVQLEKRKGEIEDRAKELYKITSEEQAQLGKLNQEKNQYLKKCGQRNELIKEAVDKMRVRIEKNWQNNDNVPYAIRELEEFLDSLESGLMCLIAEKDAEEQLLQKAVDEVRTRVISTENEIKMKKNQLDESQKKLTKVERELMDKVHAEGVLKTCIDKLEQVNRTIFALKSTFKEIEEARKTEAYRKELKIADRKLEALEAEYKILRQNDVFEGKIESEKQLIMEKQKEISRIKMNHSENLKQLFGNKVPDKNLKDAVLVIQANADFAVKNLNEKINMKQKEVTTLEVQRQNQMEKIATCEKELKEKQKKIAQTCNGKDFNEILETSFQKKERLQRDKGQYSSVKVIFAQYIKEFEKESPCCPICETNFRQKGDVVKKIITTLKSKLETVPQKLSVVEEELKKEEDQYDQLQQLKIVNNEIEVIESETLPQMKNQLENINANLKKFTIELESLKTELKEPQKKIDISKLVISDVTALDQNQNDIAKSEINLEMFKRELVKVASNKSKQEVEAEIDSVKSEITELRMRIEAQTKKLNNHRDRLEKLMFENTALTEKQCAVKETLIAKPGIEAQKIELEKTIPSLNLDITRLESDLNQMQVELQNAIEKKETGVKANREQIDEERKKLTEYSNTVSNIKNLQGEVEDYVKNKIDEKISMTVENLNKCREKEEKLEITKRIVVEAITKKKEDLAKQEMNFQTLKNNVILREKKALEVKLESEVQALKTSIGGYNYRTVYEEKQRLTAQRQNLEKEINNITGEKTGLITNIKEMRTELSKLDNKNAHSNYMKKLYEMKITEHAKDDLYRYFLTLERAIIEFHKTKMTQINRNIRELWRDIYRGNDIDYIEMKTDDSTGNAKRRTYNYRVVQVKKGVELDMRGRCSAGQKVLACLIIRMALAESLSANCGIFALDEPTTNLDKENIESLAETLARIVTVRGREKNFQLVVITHDEDFVNTMSRVGGVTHFYRVERDRDGFSCIKRERVA